MYSGNLRQIVLLTLSFLLISVSPLFGQKLNVDVHINSSQIEGIPLNYLDDLDEEIENYLSGYSWTLNNFHSQEQIKANIQIILTSASPNYTFTADLIIRAVRPVDNTARQTTLFLYRDDNWAFQYLPNQTLVHNELQFSDITTLLNFYANLILGYHRDSFEVLGGTPYFVEAQEQVSVAQMGYSPGWQRSGTNPDNRAQLISDITNPNYEPFRKAFYRYHRQGLDLFTQNPKIARENILEALKMIQQAKQQTVNNLLFNTFFNAKHREIVSIFKNAPPEMRSKVFSLLSEIDVSHLNTYRELQ